MTTLPWTLSLLLLAITLACTRFEAGVATKSSGENSILGGNPVSTTEAIAKSTVQIMSFQVHDQRDGKRHVLVTSTCTGTVIAPDIVLTAAHCTSQKTRQMWVYFSARIPLSFENLLLEARLNPRLRQVIATGVTKSWNAKERSDEPAWSDIALLKLAAPAPEDVLSAPLLPAGTPLFVNEPVVTAGYGIVNITTKNDAGNLQRVLLTIANPQIKTGEFLVNTDQQKGVCGGDSGGPAYVQRNGNWFLAGVTSRPEFRPTPTTPFCSGNTIFTEASFFSKWIQETKLQLQALPANTKNGWLIN